MTSDEYFENFDYLEHVIRSLPARNLPPEYLLMVRAQTSDGEEYIMEGEDIQTFFENVDKYDLVEVSVIMNTTKIANAIITGVEEIYEEVNRMSKKKIKTIK